MRAQLTLSSGQSTRYHTPLVAQTWGSVVDCSTRGLFWTTTDKITLLIGRNEALIDKSWRSRSCARHSSTDSVDLRGESIFMLDMGGIRPAYCDSDTHLGLSGIWCCYIVTSHTCPPRNQVVWRDTRLPIDLAMTRLAQEVCNS